MGHGLQMWLQTMWFLARSQNASTVILDEPDVYMHADLQRRLIRLLKTGTRQTIVATHSVEIMSEVAPEDVMIVDKTRRKSSFAASLPAVQGTIDQLGGVHNIHLARLWSSRRCLHVEGKDVPFLKAVQDILYSKSEVPFDIIPHLSVGGWTGWPQAIGATKSMKNAAGETITSYCIIDSDYHTEDEISQRYEQASKHDVNLHVWDRKEIENYFLIPSAIARLISGNMSPQAKGPSVDEIMAKMDEIANNMKDDVFDALSQEYLSRNRSGGATQANKDARKRMNKDWETSLGKLNVVSGKKVISELSKWSKDSYGVSFGALTIARNLKKNEIPIELKGVVKAIEFSECFPDRFAPLA